MARLFVAALIFFGLTVVCIFAQDEELQAVDVEYVKMLKCTGSKLPKLGPDGHALQCIPGLAGPNICGHDYSCWFNGFNYLCCPMEEESVQETAPVSSVSQIRYSELPVDSVEVAELDTENDELSSAEIVRISKTKTSVTRTPKNRIFPRVTLASGEPISSEPRAAVNDTAQQHSAPIVESIDEAIEYVDPDLEAQVDALEKWQDVCPPTSSPLTAGTGQLLPCLPRDKSCPAGSFCWFSTEEDYICCTVPSESLQEQPTTEPADSSATFPANSSAFQSFAEQNVTSQLEQSQVTSVVLESVAHNSTEKEVNSESIVDVQIERLQPVPNNFGREQSAENIWFKPQPQANRVEQPSVQNETLSVTQLNGTETTEEATNPTEKPFSSRRRAQARLPATKEESPNAPNDLVKGPVPPAPTAAVGGINGSLSNTKLPTPGLPSFVEQATIPLYDIDSSKKSNLPDAIQRPAKNSQPQSRYVPNPAGGYTLEEYAVPQQSSQDEAKIAAKEAAKVFYLNQIRNGWPYADEFHVPDQLNVKETSGASAAVVDEGPIEIQFPQIQQIPRPRQSQPQQPELNPDIEYNYNYARWQDRNRARWSK